jgi:hypothetical protein
MHYALLSKTFTGPLISFQIVRQEIKFYVYEEIKSLPSSKVLGKRPQDTFRL